MREKSSLARMTEYLKGSSRFVCLNVKIDLGLASLFERESSSVKKRAKWIQPNCGISELVGLLELWESQRLCLLRDCNCQEILPLEWNVLLNSGILKTVNKDGSLVDLQD
ncbi:unnamed protein product [Schistosoma curassoni]|nr:unnamed protein product [Schistosoma curassoni]